MRWIGQDGVRRSLHESRLTKHLAPTELLARQVDFDP